jgi:hypothetical protein
MTYTPEQIHAMSDQLPVKRNTTWTITAGSPLLRPGLTITIKVSEKYVVEETQKLMDKIREINEASK